MATEKTSSHRAIWGCAIESHRTSRWHRSIWATKLEPLQARSHLAREQSISNLLRKRERREIIDRDRERNLAEQLDLFVVV